jgi:HEXXH motif-containing protein
VLSTHSLSIDSFDILATGRGSAAVVNELKAISRSRQLVLLRAVLDLATSRADATGPLPPLDAAWDLLVAAEQSAPAAVEIVVTHPNVGAWAAYSLRRLKGLVDARTPLWATLGHLHNIAAAAAIRAGVDFDTKVVASHGNSILPTLGLKTLNATLLQPIQISRQHGRIEFDDQTLPGDLSSDSDGWLAVRRLEAGNCTVWFDDLDTYRGFSAPLPPNRLPDNEFQQWQEKFEATWSLLAADHPGAAAELAAGLTVLIPSTGEDRFTPFSATSRETFGSVAMSMPRDPAEFAVTLVHEFAHSKLSSLLDLVELHTPDSEPRFYAPWRDDPRPLSGFLQGVYSFVAIVSFWRVHRNTGSRLAHFEFAHWREQVTKAALCLRDDSRLTEFGRRFVAGMLAQLSSWQDEQVPADLLLLARNASLDHQATWSLTNRVPDPARVAELAGVPRAAALEPVTPEPSRRTALLRLKLADPEAFDRFDIADLPGATEADLAFVNGDNVVAAARYLAQLRADPRRPGPWIGLGLARGSAALLEQPDLVRAVHQQMADPPDPVHLAEWIAGR